MSNLKGIITTQTILGGKIGGRSKRTSGVRTKTIVKTREIEKKVILYAWSDENGWDHCSTFTLTPKVGDYVFFIDQDGSTGGLNIPLVTTIKSIDNGIFTIDYYGNHTFSQRCPQLDREII